MKKKHFRTFAFLVAWLLLAIALSFFVSSLFTEIALSSFFLLIAILVVVRAMWIDSAGSLGISSSKSAKRGSSPTWTYGNMSRTVSSVRNSANGSLYGRRQVAQILREALLSKYIGRSFFPANWIATSNGDKAVEEILRSKNSIELVEVFEPNELSDSDGRLFASLRRRRDSSVEREAYLLKLDKALSLIEEQ